MVTGTGTVTSWVWTWIAAWVSTGVPGWVGGTRPAPGPCPGGAGRAVASTLASARPATKANLLRFRIILLPRNPSPPLESWRNIPRLPEIGRCGLASEARQPAASNFGDNISSRRGYGSTPRTGPMGGVPGRKNYTRDLLRGVRRRQ